jgi:NAD(P)-dependent dehydrogenase (short-subunit alcohol dehydrogenase family)
MSRERREYLDGLFGLAGKVAVVTGGGGVLAGSIAEALLGSGARVSLWGRGAASLESAKARLESSTGVKGGVHTAVADTAAEDQVRGALAAAEEAAGTPEILVNGVGGTRGKCPFTDIDAAAFEEVLKLNLVAGLVVPTKVIARRWVETGVKGSIINIASMSSYVPLSGVWAYGAAKAGVVNLTMACAKEFAPHGIRVNAVAPGFFLGKQNRALLFDERTGELTERGRAVIGRTPFGRFGDAGELAGAVIFLASASSSGFVTGVTIPVDGGFLVDNI